MRIVYLHQYFNTPQMSGGTRSYEMARRLVSLGHEVHMITSRREVGEARQERSWQITKEDGIEVHWLPVPYSNAMSYARRILAFFRFAVTAAHEAARVQGDVVFATSTPLTIALPGAYAAWRRRIPMVFEVRDLWPEVPIAMGAIKGRLPIALARRLERFAYRRSRSIVALSPSMKAGVVSTGYPESEVTVIPNSADLDLFRVPAEAGREFRMRYDWLQDRPLVVYLGTLGRVNGVEYLVKVAAAVRSIAPEARFLVVGEGGEKEHVMRIARELGVYDESFFMLPSLPKREMPVVLSAADIATSVVIPLPELWGNSANKFFDALASGTPIAINHAGWQADLIQESGAGFVLNPTDIAKAAQALVNALRDKDWLMRAGAAGRKLAEERFSRDDLARELERVLREAAESPRNAAAAGEARR